MSTRWGKPGLAREASWRPDWKDRRSRRRTRSRHDTPPVPSFGVNQADVKEGGRGGARGNDRRLLAPGGWGVKHNSYRGTPRRRPAGRPAAVLSGWLLMPRLGPPWRARRRPSPRRPGRPGWVPAPARGCGFERERDGRTETRSFSGERIDDDQLAEALAGGQLLRVELLTVGVDSRLDDQRIPERELEAFPEIERADEQALRVFDHGPGRTRNF
jgi:hypothetical protein